MDIVIGSQDFCRVVPVERGNGLFPLHCAVAPMMCARIFCCKQRQNLLTSRSSSVVPSANAVVEMTNIVIG